MISNLSNTGGAGNLPWTRSIRATSPPQSKAICSPSLPQTRRAPRLRASKCQGVSVCRFATRARRTHGSRAADQIGTTCVQSAPGSSAKVQPPLARHGRRAPVNRPIGPTGGKKGRVLPGGAIGRVAPQHLPCQPRASSARQGVEPARERTDHHGQAARGGCPGPTRTARPRRRGTVRTSVLTKVCLPHLCICPLSSKRTNPPQTDAARPNRT